MPNFGREEGGILKATKLVATRKRIAASGREEDGVSEASR